MDHIIPTFIAENGKWLWLISAILLFICLISGCSFKKKPISFAVYYGNDPKILKQLQTFDLWISEPDHIFSVKESKGIPIGYISLGEINEHRAWWPQISDKDWILENNPEWPDAHKVDIRNLEWHNFVLDQIIPKIIAKGYRGLFMDTMDSPIQLEEDDSTHFAGCKQALLDLVGSIRKRYPKLLLISNNALRLLPALEERVDYLLVEDLNSGWDSQLKKYRKTDADWKASRLKQLSQVKKPVLVIDYMNPTQKDLIQDAKQTCKAYGFSCFMATRELDHIPSQEEVD